VPLVVLHNSLPSHCLAMQGSTTAHTVNPALLWPKAARDSSARGTSYRCRKDSWRPTGPGYSVPRESSGRQRAATTPPERYNGRSIAGSAALSKEQACPAVSDVLYRRSISARRDRV
jgi:hypothetical protein